MTSQTEISRIEDQINGKLNQVEQHVNGLPTLIEKLRYIETSFPTDDDTLKKVARQAQMAEFQHAAPLFADAAEQAVPDVTELSGFGVYAAMAVQGLLSTTCYDKVIKSYQHNPV